jgi:hypothetical protein
VAVVAVRVGGWEGGEDTARAPAVPVVGRPSAGGAPKPAIGEALDREPMYRRPAPPLRTAGNVGQRCYRPTSDTPTLDVRRVEERRRVFIRLVLRSTANRTKLGAICTNRPREPANPSHRHGQLAEWAGKSRARRDLARERRLGGRSARGSN